MKCSLEPQDACTGDEAFGRKRTHAARVAQPEGSRLRLRLHPIAERKLCRHQRCSNPHALTSSNNENTLRAHLLTPQRTASQPSEAAIPRSLPPRKYTGDLTVYSRTATAKPAAAMGTSLSQLLKEGNNTRLFWAVAAVAGAATVFCLTSGSGITTSKQKECSDEELVAILRTIVKEFHKIFAEAAQMTSNLLSSLQAKGKGRPTPRSLRETVRSHIVPPFPSLRMLACPRLDPKSAAVYREGAPVFLRLELSHVRRSCAPLGNACNNPLLISGEWLTFADGGSHAPEDAAFTPGGCRVGSSTKGWDICKDLEVKQLVAGLRQMHEDSVQGILPLLPGLELPEELTQERVLQILHKIQRLKEQKFREILQSTSDKELSSEGATPVITSQLQDSNTEAETAVLKEEELLLQHERQQKQNAPSQQQLVLTPLIFLQAIAVHSRDPEFKAKKAAIDQNHSERIFDLLRRGRTLDPIVAVCHKRLQQSSWPEFALRLESCEGMDAFILCLVSPATSSGNSNDVSAPLGLLEEFSAFLDEAESLNLELDSLAAVCLDSETLPETGEKYAPVREAVYRHGHCFALFKGESLQVSNKRSVFLCVFSGCARP
ncbi:hypothetical protein cyc_05355 [Cyclospora cayetanensis]|uniref:Uncharacterized protein n=1 Tax=Cyclospora cayetanensis TaxID=88456 RepID=A0A1D3CRY5_9EIME|nr:hypothetical protein cyc_05355 [Cyclospora cayetanensis]